MFKDFGYECINADSAIKVDLKTAFDEINKLELIKEDEGIFMGFINDRDETLHFFPSEGDLWFIDYPSITNEDIFQDENVNKENVKKIIENFYYNREWKNLCNLKKLPSPIKLKKGEGKWINKFFGIE